MNRRLVPRGLAIAAAAAVLVLAVPGMASAHVTVGPTTVTAGSYATLTFKVPTESATASTVKIEVDLPAATPFGSVSYQAVPGWTATVTDATLATPVTTDDGTITQAPASVVWTATDGGIAPGQFQTFLLSVGPVPDASTISFAAHQTYSDGTVVDWDEATPTSGAEPEHPAPVITVAAASATAFGTDHAAQPAVAAGDRTARWFGVAGIAVGALALVVAVLALLRRPGERRSDGRGPDERGSDGSGSDGR